MGYTTNTTKLLVGLSCSSISDTWDAFSQNIKTVEEYQNKVNEGCFPITKGHILNNEDLEIRQHILNLMCTHQTNLSNSTELFIECKNRLMDFELDELIELKGYNLLITKKGEAFLRNICLALDKRFWQKVPEKNIFSSAT